MQWDLRGNHLLSWYHLLSWDSRSRETTKSLYHPQFLVSVFLYI